MSTEQHDPATAERRPEESKEVTIVVNTRPVDLPDRSTTGLAIKTAAIDQGVPIKLDFHLFRISGKKETPIGDEDRIKVHEREEFRAVDKDDNS